MKRITDYRVKLYNVIIRDKKIKIKNYKIEKMII